MAGKPMIIVYYSIFVYGSNNFLFCLLVHKWGIIITISYTTYDNGVIILQGEAAQDTAGPSQVGVSPPLSPFAVQGVQAAADRTEAADDGRFSSLQRLSGSASTSQQVHNLVCRV